VKPEADQDESIQRAANRDRFYVQGDKHHLFQDWGKDDETSALPSLKDAFVFAAAVGWANGRRQPLAARQHVGFWRSFGPQEDVPLLEAIAIAETGDPLVLANRGALLTIVEEYANGGIDVVNAYKRDDRDATVLALSSLIAEIRAQQD
jgi:dnd system-associated protein 4